MKIRKSFTLDKKLLEELSEFRWRNRINSLSEALEIVLSFALRSLPLKNFIREGRQIREERKVNNEIYKKIKDQLEGYEGKYVIIALGTFMGTADDFHKAINILKSKAPDAKHAIIKKIGRVVEVEREWPGILERLK
jgi:predicted aconitase